MNFFRRLFGRKPKIQEPSEHGPPKERQPAQDIPISEIVAEKEPQHQSNPNPMAKGEVTKPAAPKLKKTMPFADTPQLKEITCWRTFSIFIRSLLTERVIDNNILTTFTLSIWS